MPIEVPVCTMTQCDAIRSMTGNVTSSRTFLGAKCASNHPHKCDCSKLEIVVYLHQSSVTCVKKHRLCNNAVFFKCFVDRASVYQYSETKVMHFLFNLLRIKGLYMFRALLAHPQEVLHQRHLVYCVSVMSVGCTWCITLTQYTKCR
jgi:hypothetical protein